MSIRPLVVLGGSMVVLVAVLVFEYHIATLGDSTLPAAARHSSSALADAPRAATSPLRDEVKAKVNTILLRPLFSPDRRPPPAGGAASAESGLPRLSGVLISGNDKSVIFAASAGGKPIVVSEGGRIGAYVVQSINDGEAVVIGPGGKKILRPAFGKGPPPVAAVASAPHQMSILDQLRNGPPPSVGIPGLNFPSRTAAPPVAAAPGKSR